MRYLRRKVLAPVGQASVMARYAAALVAARQRVDAEVEADAVALFREVVGEPDAWQAELLRDTRRRVVACCSRQSGKSTVAAVKALHEARVKPRSLWLMIGPTLRQAQELFQKARDVVEVERYRATPIDDGYADAAAVKRMLALRGVTQPVEMTALRVTLQNGSRIVALPGARPGNVRGYTADGVVVDEAAFCADALFSALSPMLAVRNGQLLLLSTPFGQRGFFWTAWQEPTWARYTVTWRECPRISPEFIDQERRHLGPLFAQEYEAVFLPSSLSPFDFHLVAKARNEQLQQWVV